MPSTRRTQGTPEPHQGLRQTAAGGVFWGASTQGLRQLIQLAVTAILARYVLPEQFGLMGMASAAMASVAPFNEMGMGAALVQKRDLARGHVAAVFWAQMGASVAMGAAIALAAPLIAAFFKREELVPLLRVLSLNLPLGAAASAPQSLLLRDLRFRSLALVETGVLAVAGTTAATLAVAGWGVWSLVAQSLIASLLTAACVLMLARFNPLSRASVPTFSQLRELSSFSGPLAGYQILNFVSRNIDDVLIGKFLGATALGYYSLAYRVMMYPLQKVSGTIERVFFPAFSTIQDDPARLSRAYVKAAQFIALITFPMMAVMMVAAPEITRVLFGPGWTQAVPLIAILSAAGLAGSIGTTVGNIYLATGRSDLMLRWGAFASACSVASIAIGLIWGVLGVTISFTIMSLILWPISHYFANRLIGLSLTDFYRSLLPPAVLAAVIAALIALLRLGWAPVGPASQTAFLLVGGGIAACVYGSCFLYGSPRVLSEAVNVARETFKGVARRRPA
jgi:PST family polysaccharide transporter